MNNSFQVPDIKMARIGTNSNCAETYNVFVYECECYNGKIKIKPL